MIAVVPIGPRLLLAPPYPDESLSSVMRRAAELYRTDPETLWCDLLESPALPATFDLDNPPARALRRLAAALAVPAATLHLHRIDDGPAGVASSARHAVCPVCCAADEAAGRVPYRRRAWSRVLETFCREHDVPLVFDPRAGLSDFRNAPGMRIDWRVFVSALNHESTGVGVERIRVLRALQQFERSLDAAHFAGAASPSDWSTSPRGARDGLLRTLVPPLRETLAPIEQVDPGDALRPWIHAPRRFATARALVDWDAFRGIADPAVRRAALWLVARDVDPSFPLPERGWLADVTGKRRAA